MYLRTALLLTLLTSTPAWAATPPDHPAQPDTRINLPSAASMHPAQPLPIDLPQQAASAPQALNPDGTPADDAPEAPHYYRWVDEQGHVHFSDRPPEGKIKKVKKEALTPAPETGGGSNLTQIYQRANSIMTPPTQPNSSGQHGGNWQPPVNSNTAHQPDAPPSSP